MELAWLADKYNIAGLEAELAQYIKGMIIANPYPDHRDDPTDLHTHWLTLDHILSAAVLPRENPVRRALAAASVRGYLRSEKHKFAEETQTYPSFGADLLREVRLALNESNGMHYASYEAPLVERE